MVACFKLDKSAVVVLAVVVAVAVVGVSRRLYVYLRFVMCASAFYMSRGRRRASLVVVVRRDVRGREVAASIADLALPPVVVGTIDDRDDVAASELELARLLRREVVHRLHQELFRLHVFELDVLRTRHGRRAVVLDQFVQRVEFDHPQEKLARCVAQHFEMLNTVAAPVHIHVCEREQ